MSCSFLLRVNLLSETRSWVSFFINNYQIVTELSDRHRADRDQDRPGRPSALILETIQQQTDQQYPPRRSASQKARQRIQEGRHAVFVDVIHQLTADRDQEGRQRFSFDRLAVADLQT